MGLNFEKKIITNGGNTIESECIRQIERALDDKNRVCLIFDADGSYDNSLKRIKDSLQEELGYKAQDVEIFLFPNNQDKGNLETLLEKIATKQKLIECFDSYVKCIEEHSKAGKNINKKSKWYAYCEASGLEKAEKKQKDKINYQQYFNFESQVLENLKKFFLNKGYKAQ